MILISHAPRSNVPAPESGQVTPAHISEGSEQHEAAIPHRNSFGDLEDDGKRNRLALAGLFLTSPCDPARIARNDAIFFGLLRTPFQRWRAAAGMP